MNNLELKEITLDCFIVMARYDGHIYKDSCIFESNGTLLAFMHLFENGVVKCYTIVFS